MARKSFYFFVTFTLFFVGNFCSIVGAESSHSSDEIIHYEVDVLQTIPHDENSFTQGLLIHNGSIYESTGRYNESSLREVNLSNGQIIRSYALNGTEFGEGLAIHNESLIQLTWKNGVAHRYDVDTFNKTGTFSYDGDGWGICSTTSNFVMSNGSSQLSIRNFNNFSIEETINVTYNGSPLDDLNELECVGDFVYANVWHWEWIFIIDLNSGMVVGTIDAAPLFPDPSPGVLNGIAYDISNDTFWLTGKYWPVIYQVQFRIANVNDNAGDISEEIDENSINEGLDNSVLTQNLFLFTLSCCAGLLTYIFWGNGFFSPTTKREIDNPPVAASKGEEDE